LHTPKQKSEILQPQNNGMNNGNDLFLNQFGIDPEKKKVEKPSHNYQDKMENLQTAAKEKNPLLKN
jgi:ferritin